MKITILDFSTTEVFIFPYDENIYDDVEDFFDSAYCTDRGIRKTNCQYMVSDNLTLQIF
jgi:hypothetical protein